MSHWASLYIGVPWEYGAQGPESFDCWNFVREVQRAHYGIEMPIIDYGKTWQDAAHNLEHHSERDNWVPVDNPQDGDVVMMARARLPVHIGVWISANGRVGVLHCLQGTGVVFQPRNVLAVSGWGGLQFYRHRK